jgi:hypothetical protein
MEVKAFCNPLTEINPESKWSINFEAGRNIQQSNAV